jgi:hypothetical protein
MPLGHREVAPSLNPPHYLEKLIDIIGRKHYLLLLSFLVIKIINYF